MQHFFFKSSKSGQGSQVRLLQKDEHAWTGTAKGPILIAFLLLRLNRHYLSQLISPQSITLNRCVIKRAKDEGILEKPYGQTSQQLHTDNSSMLTLQERAIYRAELNLSHGRLSIAHSPDRWTGIQTQYNKLWIHDLISSGIYILYLSELERQRKSVYVSQWLNLLYA